MAALTFPRPRWTLALAAVAVTACTFADQRTFTRHTGTNVTWAFPVPNGTTTAWLKRPGSDKYIFYCRDGHPTHHKDQEESFKGRVEGVDFDEISCVFSLAVSNLTIGDSGSYEFHGVGGDGRRFGETISLPVTERGQTEGHTEDGGKEDARKEDGGKEVDGSVRLIVGLTLVLGWLMVLSA